jgi:arsenate reductase
MGDRPRVLFLCTGNSCRSQMAEGWLRHLAGESLEALSAGTHPVGVNPRAVAAMAEAGVDISSQRCESIADHFQGQDGRGPDLVITVCDAAAAACPTLPGATARLHWPFPDPIRATGTDEEIAAAFANVRDALRERLEAWLACGAPFGPA